MLTHNMELVEKRGDQDLDRCPDLRKLPCHPNGHHAIVLTWWLVLDIRAYGAVGEWALVHTFDSQSRETVHAKRRADVAKPG